MTEKEVVQALRCCAEGECKDCQLYGKIACVETLCKYALDLIERLTDENAKAEAERDALLGELRKSGCTYCKYETVCEDNPWIFIRKVCDPCGKQERCVCHTCTGDGSSTDNWEWRGAPKEGGKADA